MSRIAKDERVEEGQYSKDDYKSWEERQRNKGQHTMRHSDMTV